MKRILFDNLYVTVAALFFGHLTKFWTPELFKKIEARSQGKMIYRIILVKEMNSFTKQFGDAKS